MQNKQGGKMIVMRNNDVPGVIGEVGKILGDNNINIADFRLSRGKEGALSNNPIPQQQINELQKSLPNCKIGY
jgi:D-3-phosphoglycerate dehydrogenase